MKNAIVYFATFNLLFISVQSLCAQKIATWKGGTPGRPAEWNCPANWKEGRIPNEFSKVIIPDVSTNSFHNPALNEGEVEVWSLQILSGAMLHIGENASLIVIEQDSRAFITFGEGIIQSGSIPESLVFLAR